MNPLTILQWNPRSLRPKKPSLLHLINSHHPAVIAVAETWLKPGAHFRVPGYSCLRHDRAVSGGAGSALFIRHSLPFSQIPLPPVHPDIYVVAAKIMDISYISIYIPHPSSNLIADILHLISSIPPPIMLMGDFNAHHTSWGSSKTDYYSLSLLEVVDESDLCIINDGTPTRRVSPLQDPNSAVDLTICSPSLAPLLSWQVLTQSHGSDHFPILISIPNRVIPTRNFNPSLKYRLSDVDWSSFATCLESKINLLTPTNSTNLIDNYSKFIESVTSSADENFPQKKPYNYKVSTPWWDPECTAAAKKRKESEKKYNMAMTVENYLEYKENAAKATRLFTKKKRQGWKNYCQNLSPRTPPSVVWKQIKQYRGSFSSDNNAHADPATWLGAFANKMSPPSAPNWDSLPSPPIPLPSLHYLDSPFSHTELQLALDGLQDSAPGADGIPYSFLKNASEKCKEYYLDLVNNIFSSGIFPESWKSQVVIPILKSGKNPSDPNSRRPIALSSVLAKIAEHMAKNRLEWYVEHKNILAKSQYGFRKGMSTIDNLAIITTDIRITLVKKQYLVGVFLDIEAAYDNVLLPELRRKLMKLSLPEKFVRFLTNPLMGRTISVKGPTSSLPPGLVWKGLPQGSVTSPILYSLYTYDLEDTVQPHCQILQYADDLVLYVSDKSLDEAVSQLNRALEYLTEWLTLHGLSLSASKSKVVVFSNKRLIPPVRVKINNKIIPEDTEVKFLGVWLDRKLTGTPHFEYISQKCEKNINVLRSLSGVWWGAHPFTQRLMYNAIIRSHLDYASFLLDPSRKLGLQKLDKIQSKSLRIILGSMKSSPINAMQVECSEPPLSLRRQYLADRYYLKMAQHRDHPLLLKLEQLSALYHPLRLSDDDISCLLRSYVLFSRLPNPLFQTSISPLFTTPYNALTYQPNIILDLGIDKNTIEANKIFAQKMHTEYQNWIKIFTDASKSSLNPVGAAVWIPSTRIVLSYKCPSVTSVFTGESIAILEAIHFIKSHGLNNSIILSDSKSCLQSIISNPFRSKTRFPTILKIREELFDSYNLGINIVLAWIPGHAGIIGNENADACARTAVQIGSLDYSQIYSHDMCAIPKPILYKCWSQKWQISKTEKGRFYGELQPDIPHKPWFSKFQRADKVTTSTICRLRLNHSCTPVFLTKLRIRDNSICECGLDEGNVDHIFFNCPLRQPSLYDIIPIEIPRPISFKYLLTLVSTPFVNILCKYIKKNKIKL